MKRLIFMVLTTAISFGFTLSNGADSYSLFHIGRSRDANLIKYDINLNSNGTINTEKPINVYWIKYTNGSKVEGLSYIQEKWAYGIKYISITNEEVKFQFVSYSGRTFVLKKVNGDKYKVITYLDKKGVELKRIHIQIDGGTFMLPKISYVNMYWKDPFKENEGVETIKP